jgi:DNA repair protein RadC
MKARSEDTEPYQPESNLGDGSSPPSRRLGKGADVAVAFRKIVPADEMREHFVMFSLDTRHRIIREHTIAIGTLTGVEVHPREVFRPAIMDCAAAIVVAHNHPSNDPTPSREDVQLTNRLREVGELVGIPILDHVIVVRGGVFVSLAERGWV